MQNDIVVKHIDERVIGFITIKLTVFGLVEIL